MIGASSEAPVASAAAVVGSESAEADPGAARTVTGALVADMSTREANGDSLAGNVVPASKAEGVLRSHGARKLYDLPDAHVAEPAESANAATAASSTADSGEQLLDSIRRGVIGEGSAFRGPFGFRHVLYADWTASGRNLDFIEDYVRDNVLPFYGNTHTTTTVTALQTTMFRHEARDLIRKVCNAGDEDAVIFVGSGTTGAVHKLIHGLSLPSPTTAATAATAEHPLVVFVGPYEHHSSLLPWREAGAFVVTVPEDAHGQIDVAALERGLARHCPTAQLMIGCFAAASNVTGVLTDTDRIAAVLHAHGALAFFDYATAGP